MLLQISVAHDGSHESCGILDTCCIGLRIGTVQGQVEVEVVEVLLQLQEVVQEGDFLQGACAVEIVHRTLAVFFADTVSLEHVHNLGTQRSHTGTATDPNHFTTGAVLGTELSVRTAHDDLVAGLQ